MKLSTVSFWCIPASLLLMTGLLSTTAWAGSYAYHTSHLPSVPWSCSPSVIPANAGIQGCGGGAAPGAGIPAHAGIQVSAQGHPAAHAVHDEGHDVGGSRHGGHYGGKHMKYGKDHRDMPSHDGKHGGEYGGYGRHERHTGAHRGAMEFIDHILKFQEGMSLTDDQVQQLHTLKTNYLKSRITMKADIKLAKIDLHELLEDEQASLADIETQLNALHGLKAKLYLESIKAQRQAMAVLSEEQRSRMDTIHERIKSHGGEMMHRDGSPGHRKHNGYGQE